MIKPFHISFTIIAAVLLFCGCETYINDFEYREKNTRIVVNAILQPDSIIKVNISNSETINPHILSGEISDAKVEMFEDDQSMGILEHTGNGYYILRNKHPEPGRTYRIEIEAGDYENVWAETHVPAVTNITSVDESFIEIVNNDDWGGFGGTDMAVQYIVNFDISTTETQWFGSSISSQQPHVVYPEYECIELESPWINESGWVSYDSCFAKGEIDTIGVVNRYEQIKTNDRSVKFIKTNFHYYINDMDSEPRGEKFYFTNLNQTAGNMSFNIKMNQHILLENIDNEITIHLDCYDKALFQFLYSLAQSQYTDDDPFAEKTSIYSNIKGGLGVFGSVSSHAYTIKYEDDLLEEIRERY